MLPAYAGFEPADVASVLDFQSVHLYPESGHEEAAAAVLARARASGPVVVEELGAIHCSVPELARFMHDNDRAASGWVGFYWGKPPTELRASSDVGDALLVGTLDMFTAAWSAAPPPPIREW